jgi:hypothetical protein
MEDDFQSALFTPWVVLPGQLGTNAEVMSDVSGPVALMLAVLEDAIRCIERGRRYRHPRIRKVSAEADAWMRSDSREWPFAFASICDVVGLDIDATRACLLNDADDVTVGRRQRSPVWRVGSGRGRTAVCAPPAASQAA